MLMLMLMLMLEWMSSIAIAGISSPVKTHASVAVSLDGAFLRC
jgi:hypothetical protein